MREYDYPSHSELEQRSRCYRINSFGLTRNSALKTMDIDCPVSETKQSFQKKNSLHRQRFVKPRAEVSGDGRLVSKARKPVVRAASVITRHQRRSVPCKKPASVTSLVETSTTEALLSPRYQSESVDLANHTDFVHRSYHSKTVYSGHYRRNSNATKNTNDSYLNKQDNLNFSSNKINYFNRKNPLNRRLFNTSEEFIMSINSNMDTHPDHSQSTDTLFTPRGWSPDPPADELDLLVQSTDALYFPPPNPPSHPVAIPRPSAFCAPPHYLSSSVDMMLGTPQIYPDYIYHYEDNWTPQSSSFDQIDRLVLPPTDTKPLRNNLGSLHAKSVGDVRTPHRSSVCYFTPLKAVTGNVI